MATRLEFVGGTSRKFWEVERVGNVLQFRWGRIGTNGQKMKEQYGDERTANSEMQARISAKLKKGYFAPSMVTFSDEPAVMAPRPVPVAPSPKRKPTTPNPPPVTPDEQRFANLEFD